MRKYKINDKQWTAGARPDWLGREGLLDAKRRIEADHITWDILKKSHNAYELVSHPGVVRVSDVRPVSRSFFKLWEMLQEFPQLKACLSGRVAAVAEGPGGFVQAMLVAGAHDVQAITLVNRNSPVMRVSDQRLRVHTVDGSGDICRKHVAKAFVEAVGQQVSMFTADGGFDVRGCYDRQEEVSFNLIRAEVGMGLSCLAQGGCMVIKVYDMFREDTRNAVAVLCECFRTVFVYKPCISRPANSERYLVCVERVNSPMRDRVLASVLHGAAFPKADRDARFDYNMDLICEDMALEQLAHINAAFDDDTTTDTESVQTKQAKLWCDAYGDRICQFVPIVL